MKRKQAGRTALGAALMIVAGAALALLYTMRPPDNIGEALRLVAQGQDYIKEPYYQVLMAAAGVTALIGAALFFSGLGRRK